MSNLTDQIIITLSLIVLTIVLSWSMKNFVLWLLGFKKDKKEL